MDGAQVAVTPGARHAISGDDGAFEVRELWSGRYEISVRRIGDQPAAVSVNVHDTVAVVRVALVAIPRQLDSVRIREKASGQQHVTSPPSTADGRECQLLRTHRRHHAQIG